MLRATLLALVPLASALWLRPADACSCAPENVIEHPPAATLPAQDGLLGRLVFANTPTISVSYADDATHAQIPGNFQWLYGGSSTLWTFVPRAPFTVGRTVRAVVETAGGIAPTLSRDFLVSSSTIAGPSSFAGITGMQAILSRFQRLVGGSCAPAPQQSRVLLAGLPPPSASAPLYRYFFYPQGTTPPAEPTRYGVPGHFIAEVRCGNPSLRCEPEVSMNFQEGEVWCARVEATDLMGHRSGYDVEVCATVVAEDVELVDFGGIVSCAPPAGPDAGTAVVDGGPGPAADAGAAAADAGAAAAANDDGCTCIRPRHGGSSAALVGALLAAWVILRRRRAPL